jgi:DNA-binding CsgD family transcriptional regulator
MIDKPIVRQRVLELHAQGKSNQQIADEIGVRRNTVQGWVRNELGLKPNPSDGRSDTERMRAYTAQRVARKQRHMQVIKRMTLEGRFDYEIAQELGLSRRTVSDYKSREGIKIPHNLQVGRPKQATKDYIVARREKVKELVDLGYNSNRIGRILGISQRIIQLDRKALGIPATVGRPKWDEELISKANQMLEDGASYAETARTLGVSADVLRTKIPGKGWSLAQVWEYNSMMKQYGKYVE